MMMPRSREAEKKAQYETRNLDHLGLVAGQFDSLGLVELIDRIMPQDDAKRTVSLGQAVKAMVVNGLGFANHTLYLMPEFYADKPVERLIGANIKAEDLNQHLLGRSLDAIHAFDVTRLYSILATSAVSQLDLPCLAGHIDTTSFHVDGTYNSKEEPGKGVVHIKKGYSRDKRPDLNQVGLQLIVENQAGIPLMMQVLDGNSSDKATFAESIKKHTKHLQTELGVVYIVGDSALYTEKGIKEMKGFFWITRVPETLKEAQELIQEKASGLMTDLGEEAHCSAESTFGGVKQRWIVHYSPQANERCKPAINKKCLKATEDELKRFNRLCQNEFLCEGDARKALDKFQGQQKLTALHDAGFVKKGRYRKKGRPAKDASPDFFIWQIEGGIASIIEEREIMVRKKSCFILATNQMDTEELDDDELTHRYKKDQQKVERGFRFLKDPQFLASELYLKKPQRIMALMMVMTLSLLIYSTLEYRIRTELGKSDATFPNQKRKPIKNPTARWVFQYFSGIHTLTVKQSELFIMNINQHHQLILSILGKKFEKIYSGNLFPV